VGEAITASSTSAREKWAPFDSPVKSGYRYWESGKAVVPEIPHFVVDPSDRLIGAQIGWANTSAIDWLASQLYPFQLIKPKSF
jgi:hypothetical protein